MTIQVSVEEELLDEVCHIGGQKDPALAVQAALAEFVQRRRPDLVEEQYRLARQYPEEYVVLVGRRVLFHSRDSNEAGAAYDRAAREHTSPRPVFVKPGDGPVPGPVVRGRKFAGRLPR